jgi:hypothetical protein
MPLASMRGHRFLVPLAASVLLLRAVDCLAVELRPFISGSLAQAVAQRIGHAFILTLWSVDCTYCPTELATIGAVKRANPGLDVVLVAADSPDDAPLAAEMANRYGLGQAEQWIFADGSSERLRFEIDPHWHGELPRTYLYDGQHHVEAVSGAMAPTRLTRWVAEHVR